MRLRKWFGALVATFALLSGTGAARAGVVLTFEGQSNTIYTAPIVRSGFQIGNPAGQEQHFHEIDSTAFPGFVPNNGTGVLYNDRDTQIFVMDALGATFVLDSVDAATDLGGPGGSATQLQIIGLLNGTQVGTITAGIGGSYVTISGSSLGTVDELIFDGIGGGFTLDNLGLSPAAVPEPSTLALGSMAALMGLGYARRRRKAASRA